MVVEWGKLFHRRELTLKQECYLHYLHPRGEGASFDDLEEQSPVPGAFSRAAVVSRKGL